MLYKTAINKIADYLQDEEDAKLQAVLRDRADRERKVLQAMPITHPQEKDVLKGIMQKRKAEMDLAKARDVKQEKMADPASQVRQQLDQIKANQGIQGPAY